MKQPTLITPWQSVSPFKVQHTKKEISIITECNIKIEIKYCIYYNAFIT